MNQTSIRVIVAAVTVPIGIGLGMFVDYLKAPQPKTITIQVKVEQLRAYVPGSGIALLLSCSDGTPILRSDPIGKCPKMIAEVEK